MACCLVFLKIAAFAKGFQLLVKNGRWALAMVGSLTFCAFDFTFAGKAIPMEQEQAPQKTKKLFVIFAIIFMVIVGVIGYDISSRTTFPGSKGQLKERMFGGDSTATDTLSAGE